MAHQLDEVLLEEVVQSLDAVNFKVKDEPLAFKRSLIREGIREYFKRSNINGL